MKINILPKVTFKPWQEDFSEENKEFYTGNPDKKVDRFLTNNTLYIVAFLIPFVLLLLLMKYFEYAPFGGNSFFFTEDANSNILVLTNTIAQIQSGNFHILSFQNGLGSEMLSTFLFYFSSPFTLVCLLFDQTSAISLLTIFTIIRISLSGCFMLYYLTHRLIGRKASKYDILSLIFGLGYSLSSFALIHYADFMYLDIFMLFPLFMLSIDRLIVENKKRDLLILLVIFIMDNFYLSLPVTLLGLLIMLLQSETDFKEGFYRLLSYVTTCMKAYLVCSITAIPGFVSIAHNFHNAWPFFELSTSLSDFFMESLFYADGSNYRYIFYGLNIYTGLFSFVTIFFYIFDCQINIRRRFKDILILLLSACVITNPSIFALFCGGFTNPSTFQPLAFIYIFLILSFGCTVRAHLSSISLLGIIIAASMPNLFASLALKYRSGFPNYSSYRFSLVIMVCYLIFIVLYRIKSIKRELFSVLVVLFTIMELMANCFQLTYLNAQKAYSLQEVITTNQTSTSISPFDQGRSALLDSTDYNNSLHYGLHNYNNGNIVTSRNSYSQTLDTYQTDFSSPLDDSLSALHYLYVESSKMEEDNLDSQVNKQQYIVSGSQNGFTILENKNSFPFAYTIPQVLEPTNEVYDYTDFQNQIVKDLGASDTLFCKDNQLSVEVSSEDENILNITPYGQNIFRYTTENEDSPYNTVHFSFIPQLSGDYYLFLNELIHYGTVEAGQLYEYDYKLTPSSTLGAMLYFQGMTYDNTVLNGLSSVLSNNACSLTYTSTNQVTTNVNSSGNDTLLTAIPYSNKLVIKNNGTEVQPINYAGYIAVPLHTGNNIIQFSANLFPFYIGIICSLLTIIILSLGKFFVKKSPVLAASLREKLQLYMERLALWMIDNRIYLLSFFLPVALYTLALLYNSEAPFGSLLAINSDGAAVEIPALYSAISYYKSASLLSLLRNSSTNIIPYLLTLPYLLCSQEAVPTLVTIGILFKFGFCGFSLCYYLTHRLFGQSADKHDSRILIATLAFSMSNYMVILLNYWYWFNAIMLLPLLLLAMDYLMIKGKKRYYIILLGLSTLLNYYMTMFICFFLVIRFFTYQFANWKDFLRKGVRFALASLTNVGLAYIALKPTITMLSRSTYSNADQIGPLASQSAESVMTSTAASSSSFSSIFFNGYQYLINQMRPFLHLQSINWNEGGANIYFGILPLLLIFIYIFSRKIKLHDKLANLVPTLLLFFIFECSPLNYYFNGMHYQHGVPNRFAFIFVLLCAITAYDALCTLENSQVKTCIFATLVLLLIQVYSFFFPGQEEVELYPFIITCILLIVYLIGALLLTRKNTILSYRLISLLIVLSCLELFANATFQFRNLYTSYAGITMENDAIAYVKNQADYDSSVSRIHVVGPRTINYRLTNNANSLSILAGGSLTAETLKYGYYCGYYVQPNAVMGDTNLTPMGHALANNRYIIVDQFPDFKFSQDLGYYPAQANVGNALVFNNPYSFPYGYYLPKSAEKYIDTETTFDDLWNTYSNSLLDDSSANIIEKITLSRQTDAGTTANSYTIEETDDNISTVSGNIHIPNQCSLYFYMDKFVYWGEYDSNDDCAFSFNIATDNSLFMNDNTLDVYLFYKDVFENTYETLVKHPVTYDSKEKAYTVDFPEDGIVVFSTPYSNQQLEIDGTPTTSYSFGNALLCLKAKSGKHIIKYVSGNGKKLNYDQLITFLSWILLGICYVWTERNKKRSTLTTQ